MRIIVTILLVLVTTAVGALAFMLISPEHREKLFPTALEIRGENPFPDLEPLEVKTIEIISAEGKKGHFQFNSETSKWEGKLPWKDRAENLAPIISFASSTIVQEVIPFDDATPKELGFPDNAHTVKIKNNEGKQVAHFQIGQITAWHANYPGEEKLFPCLYLRDLSKGEKAPTLLCIDPQEKTREVFSNGLVRLRDYRPVSPYDLEGLTEVRVISKETSFVLERTLKSKNNQIFPASKVSWVITKPLEQRTDKKSIQHFLSNLAFLTADDILQPSEVTLPEDSESKIEVQLYYLYAKDPVTLTIYPETVKNNLVYATVSDRPNAVFLLPQSPTEVNPTTYTSLPKNVNDIRARNLLDLHYDHIRIATVVPKDAPPVRLAKQKYWKIVDFQGNKTTVNSNARDDLFHSLMSNSIHKFISDDPTNITNNAVLKKYGLDDPFLQVQLVDKYNHPQIIQFGKSVEFESPEGKQIGFYAHSKGKESIWLVSSSVVSKIRTKDWEWHPLTITGISISNLTNISRKVSGKPKQFLTYDYSSEGLIVREGEDKVLSSNPIITHAVDANRAAYFITQVCNLTAERRMDPQSLQALLALNNPTCTLEISYEDIETGLPTQTILNIAPQGSIDTTHFFFVHNVKTGDIFTIDRKTYLDLVAPIRYVR